MQTKLSLSMDEARAMASAAEALAQERGLPVWIAIVDESTYLQHAVRMDGAGYMSMEGAIEKARTAAEGGHPTGFFADAHNGGDQAILKIPGVTPVRGGLPAIVDGRCCGAIGISGVAPDLDEAIAAGLAVLPGAKPVAASSERGDQ
jgi:glc operon protein GlcG